MTDHDRGAYTPQNDAPLSFDARRAPGARPVPMTLLISGMVLVILLIGVVYFYRSGVRPAGQAPQVIGAPVGALKAPPPAQEQPSDAAAGLQVYKSETAPLSKAQAGPPPKFAPAPEQPAPRPAPRATPAPVQVATAAPAPAPAAPISAAIKPAVKPVKPAVVAPAASTPATASPATASPGGAQVQIGAFSSAALADKGWSDTAQVLPGAMAGKTKTVQVIQKDGHTFYRTSVGGFASKADAAGFCASLKAAGKSCIVK